MQSLSTHVENLSIFSLQKKTNTSVAEVFNLVIFIRDALVLVEILYQNNEVIIRITFIMFTQISCRYHLVTHGLLH